VTTGSERLLLDTTVLIHLIRGSPLGSWIEARFGLRERTQTPLISIVTEGEMLAFAKKRKWGEKKIDQLEALLRELVVVDISSQDVLRAYAEIDFLLEKAGHPIGQNDLWIAATAMKAEAHLLTTDRDFDPLHPGYLQRTWIDPRSAPGNP
jgi:tRNA(fMet)-specific endonuclease VapC